MDVTALTRTQKYVAARRENPAWLLLVSHRAPLILGCLSALFEQADDGIAEADALQALSGMLAEYAMQEEYGIDPENTRLQAGRDLREWIKRGLITERAQRLYSTDALAAAISFVDSLDNRIMTSTSSRLSVVQREIENLETSLNPNPASRIASLKSRIQALETELRAAEQGDVPVLTEAEAVVRIRDVYSLATSLRADFRRVEDSWREADRRLRQRVMAEQLHRGQVLDHLLDGQEALLATPEGRVFDGFQRQLQHSSELDRMRECLSLILKHPAAEKALAAKQSQDLRRLPSRLVKESQAVLQARERSEKDVKGFIKTGLAAEHHRVGQLLAEVLNLAQAIDWQPRANRRQAVPLPPLGVCLGRVPLAERLRFKALENLEQEALNLGSVSADLDADFWDALEGLDREALIRETLQMLTEQGRSLSLAELADLIPVEHDLEALALWLGLAREAGLEINTRQRQRLELRDPQAQFWCFDLPYVELNAQALQAIDWEF